MHGLSITHDSRTQGILAKLRPPNPLEWLSLAFLHENLNALAAEMEEGAWPYNRPCAQQYVGKSQ